MRNISKIPFVFCKIVVSQMLQASLKALDLAFRILLAMYTIIARITKYFLVVQYALKSFSTLSVLSLKSYMQV